PIYPSTNICNRRGFSRQFCQKKQNRTAHSDNNDIYWHTFFQMKEGEYIIKHCNTNDTSTKMKKNFYQPNRLPRIHNRDITNIKQYMIHYIACYLFDDF